MNAMVNAMAMDALRREPPLLLPLLLLALREVPLLPLLLLTMMTMARPPLPSEEL